jgi:hypothetical protein
VVGDRALDDVAYRGDRLSGVDVQTRMAVRG